MCLSSTTSTQRPPDSRLIYTGDTKYYLLSANVILGLAAISNTCDLAILAWQNASIVWEYMFDADMFLETDKRLWESLLRSSVILPLYYACWLFSQRTLNRIYFSDEEQLFVGERLSWILRKQYILFKPGSAKYLPPPPKGLFSFMKGNIEIEGKEYTINPDNFKSVPHFHLMMEKGSEDDSS